MTGWRGALLGMSLVMGGGFIVISLIGLGYAAAQLGVSGYFISFPGLLVLAGVAGYRGAFK